MELRQVNNGPIVENAVAEIDSPFDDVFVEDVVAEEVILENVEIEDAKLSADQFIHANTIPITHETLKSGCIIPVF